MRILLLAPQPFYQDRGTPIAVNHALRVLSARGDHVDLLTYHEGVDVSHPGVTIHRISRPPLVHDVPPGFSFKKIVCDVYMLFDAIRLARRVRLDMVHAVEESVFMAVLLRTLFHIPFVYDMDSSLSSQLVDAHPTLRIFMPLFRFIERYATRRAAMVLPVCPALVDVAKANGAAEIELLPDISLLEDNGAPVPSQRSGSEPTTFLYIGNLQKYQGIDLLLQSFAWMLRKEPAAKLVIVGGRPSNVAVYQLKAKQLNLGEKVEFRAPTLLSQMRPLFDEADVLVSPRTRGVNTPMKIYSYLHSGKPLVATNLETHTQVIPKDMAILAEPNAESFGQAMLTAATDPAMRTSIAERAHDYAEQHFLFAHYEPRINKIYDRLEKALAPAQAVLHEA